MLMFINVDDSPAGLPSERRDPIAITTSADCITSKSLIHLVSLTTGAEARSVTQRMVVRNDSLAAAGT